MPRSKQHTDLDFLDTVRERSPAGTSAIAEEVGCTRQLADTRLRELAEEGCVRRKQSGQCQIWYHDDVWRLVASEDFEMFDDNHPRVGNHNDETDIYVGRHNGTMLNRPVGERGWLGNPHDWQQSSGECRTCGESHPLRESIMLFAGHFFDRLRSDEEFRGEVRRLHDKTLGCYCQSLDGDGEKHACHGVVIANTADKLYESDESLLHY